MAVPTMEEFKRETAHVLTDKDLNLTEKQQNKALELIYKWFVKNKKPITSKPFRDILAKVRKE